MVRRVKRKRGRSRGQRSPDINWGQGLATVGTIGSSVGVVVSAIFMLIFVGVGIFLIYEGAKGRAGLSSNCSQKVYSSGTFNPCSGIDEKSCKSNSACEWNNTPSLSSAGKIGYIVGGVLCILFGIGILLLSIWWRGVVRRNPNLAAVAGGMTLFNAAVNTIKR